MTEHDEKDMTSPRRTCRRGIPEGRRLDDSATFRLATSASHECPFVEGYRQRRSSHFYDKGKKDTLIGQREDGHINRTKPFLKSLRQRRSSHFYDKGKKDTLIVKGHRLRRYSHFYDEGNF